MPNITYFLGAGFSAPLGLPVSTSFLEKSKDIFFSDRQKYAHFQKVFDTIRDMSFTKNFYSADLFNIEEILSVLEMKESLTVQNAQKWFLEYIVDVIKASTPTLESHKEIPENWYASSIFGVPETQHKYGAFIASLLNLEFIGNKKRHDKAPPFHVQCAPFNSPVIYSIVTPNYDVVLEMFANYLKDSYGGSSDFGFRRVHSTGAGPKVAKLHGSVDGGDIVPPTWNKSLHPSIVDEWQLAFRLLSEADQIRIVGYSLPDMDAYVRYLFKASVLESKNLKNIDVICLDPNESVRARYDSFITFPKYRFVNSNVWDYFLGLIKELKAEESPSSIKLQLDKLETFHEKFMIQRRS